MGTKQFAKQERNMYEKITLPNGARIVYEHMEGVRSAALGFWVGVGSRYEAEGRGGSAHFIEHMLFKGTERRTAAQLAEETDALGGQMNAYTTRDNTCFFTRVLDTHLRRGSDVLVDMFFNSRFDAEDVEAEKSVISEEIGMYEDNPEDVAAEALLKNSFPGALGRPVLGTDEELKGHSAESLKTFWRTNYVAPRVVAAVAGSFTDGDIDFLASALSSLKSELPAPPEPSAYTPSFTVREKSVEQNQLVLGFPGLTTASEERCAMQILSGILGGGSSSRLFQSVRERHGLCYSIYSFTAGFEDTGLFAVATATSKETEEQALMLTLEELRRVRDEGVTAEELERAREQITSSILMSLESTSSRMNRIGFGETYLGAALPVDELIERYGAVTLSELRDLAGRVLDFNRISFSAVGQVGDGETYRRIIYA